MAKDYSRIKKLSEHEHNHSFLAESLLVPNCNKTDSNRLTMFISELSQAVVLNQGEIPLIQTGFEAQVGEYTIDGYKKLEGEYTVLAKIPKNKMNYMLIVRNDETGTISHINRRECSHFTEHYGCTYNNEVIDNKFPGDKVKDEIMYSCNSYDTEGNFMYGRNMKTCYMTYKNLTYEDPIVISESAAEKLGYSNVYKVRISVNDNDLLLNLYGEKTNEEDDLFTTQESYKSFPDIGEYVNDRGILAVRRRISYNKMLKNLKNEKLKEIEPDDTSFYIRGQVVDIDIYSNMTEETLSTQKYNNQVYDLLVQDMKYRRYIVNKVEEYRKTYGDEYIHPELVAIYNQCKQLLENYDKEDQSKRNSWIYESNEFKGYILEFTVLERCNLVVGSKIANRYGGKGVVSRILPDDEMPIIEEGPFKGERPECIMNSLGVLNRLIPSILYEEEINFISMHIRKYISEKETLEEKEEEYFNYLAHFDNRQYDETVEFYNSLSEDDKWKFFDEMVENGIIILQPPFWGNIDLEKMTELYKAYPEIQEFKFEGIHRPIIMGETYIMVLKHHPSGKMSVRSTSLNSINGLPAKSKAYRDHKLPWSSTPIRLGEMEVNNLALTKSDITQKLLGAYATDEQLSEALLEALLEEPYNTEIEDHIDGERQLSKTSRIARQFFKCAGFDIVDDEDIDELEEMLEEKEEVNEINEEE